MMRIEAAPADGIYDEPVSIRLTGVPARREVTIRATALDDLGRCWQSHAVFRSGSAGVVDPEDEAPLSGSYDTRDSMGLFWSMELEPGVVERSGFVKLDSSPVEIELSAYAGAEVAAHVTLLRRYLAPGLRRTAIRSNGIVATLFEREGNPAPGVIVVGGSDGGLAEDRPALLASHGFSVLSLAYFGMEGLPKDLASIPLEYFERAIRWMRGHPAVAKGKLALLGTSRGGELALLLGSTYPADVGAVVAYAPSGLIWPGIVSAPGAPAPAAWTLGGKPLKFVAALPMKPELFSTQPVSMMPWFLEMVRNRESAQRAAIPVERIDGPVLMFSGTDDRLWPSMILADLATERLIRHDFSRPFEHVSYAGAGHYIRFPYTPVISETFHPVVRVSIALGGTKLGNHTANLDSWRRTLGFLRAHLG